MSTNQGRPPKRGWRRWPVRSLTVVAVALGSLAMVPGTANAITGCPGGDPSVNHCYALGYMGDDFGGSPVWMNAVGTDLLVSCLSVPNENTDFANYETWMGTNDNGAANTWIEEGYKAGIGFDGKNHGFIWFWADMRSPYPTNYHEHYGPAASVNSFTNVTFSWLGSGNWDVERGGSVIGESAGVGDFAGDSETGAETTVNAGHVFGESRNFQYADTAWKWHPAPTAWDNELNGNGFLFATGTNGSPGSFTEVISNNQCAVPCPPCGRPLPSRSPRRRPRPGWPR